MGLQSLPILPFTYTFLEHIYSRPPLMSLLQFKPGLLQTPPNSYSSLLLKTIQCLPMSWKFQDPEICLWATLQTFFIPFLVSQLITQQSHTSYGTHTAPTHTHTLPSLPLSRCPLFLETLPPDSHLPSHLTNSDWYSKTQFRQTFSEPPSVPPLSGLSVPPL